MSPTREKLVLIDAMALIHRAFHAIPFLATKSGELTNAVFGFTSSVLTVLKDLDPKYAAVSFDLPEPTFRHQKYADYKATRQKAPDELRSQFGRVREVVDAMGIPVFEVPGYEADDVIGSLAKQAAKNHQVDPYIVTGDRDSLQLVDNEVRVYMLKWRPGGRETVTYDPAKLKADTGMTGAEYVEYKALVGDTSDNIPGVPGVGDKTATTLIRRYHDLEGVYAALDEDSAKHPDIKPKVRENLTEHRDQAFLSRDLSRIVTDIDLDFDLGKTTLKDFDLDRAVKLFSDLEFTSLIPRVQQVAAQEAGVTESAEPSQSKPPDWSKKNYQLVGTEAELKKFVVELGKQKIFAFDTQTERRDPIGPNLAGLSFSWQRDSGYYLPINHDSGPTLDLQSTLEALRSIMTDPKISKVGHYLKYDFEALRCNGLEVSGLSFDTMLGSYLLNPGARTLALGKLAYQELGYEMQPISELIGEGKQELPLNQADSGEFLNYAAENAEVTWQLYEKLSQNLRDAGLESVLQDIELPVLPALARMEQHGVQLDTDFLAKLSRRFAKELSKLETEAHKLAGKPFNLNSPSQLSVVLFDELQLGAGVRRSGGRHKSTAAGELDKLKAKHPIVPMLIRYRELSKLQTTYVDALPKLVRSDTGRLHTSYNQTVAATGRLSSSDPNLQNIPIRTDQGREIRQAFVAGPGKKLLSADYSQFELRIAAHISGDENLAEKFRQQLDIHTATAAEVAGIPIEEVKPQQRYAAKAVNFSILYGATPHGVSQSANMSVADAGAYIENYFRTYPKLREYMDAMVARAQSEGFVETLFGRRRYLPEIHASVYPVRQAAQRMAINMPIQGTQADILKMAMIKLDAELPNVSAARMILTVHDELVFEVPEGEIEKTGKFVVDTMENAYELSVPIVAEAKVGDNWGQMKPFKL